MLPPRTGKVVVIGFAVAVYGVRLSTDWVFNNKSSFGMSVGGV